MKVAADGEAVRVLGAWIGNGTDNLKIWSKTMGNLSRVIEKWKNPKPTVAGKRHVIQMYAGGMTQFLTDVQ